MNKNPLNKPIQGSDRGAVVSISGSPTRLSGFRSRIIEQQAAAPWRKAGPVTPNHVYRSVEQFERCLAEANQPAAPAATAAPEDGLEAWERDAIQRFENSHEPAFLDPIADRGSAAARAMADAALTAHRRNRQEVAA